MSYTIAMKNLQPNTYATTCKRCSGQFTIEIPALPKKQKPPLIEKVKVPVHPKSEAENKNAYTSSALSNQQKHEEQRTDATSKFGREEVLSRTQHKAQTRGDESFRKPLESTHSSRIISGKERISNPAQEYGKQLKEQEAKQKEESKLKTSESRSLEPQSPDVDQYKETFYAKKAYKQYGLKELSKSFAKHLSPGIFLLSLTSLLLGLASYFGFKLMLDIFFDASTVYNAYIASFIQIMPLLFAVSIAIAGSTVSARIIFDREAHIKVSAGGNIALYFRALGISFATGAPALYIINILLVFLARIPAVGTLLFSLLFLPVYAASLAMVLTATAGIWFLPPVFASQRGSLLKGIPDFIKFLAKYNLRLFYIIPTLFMLAGAVLGVSLFLHGSALALTRIVSLAVAGEPVTEALSGIPVLFTQLSEFSVFEGNRDMLNFLSGGDLFARSGGFIIGLILASISLCIYSLTLSVSSVASARIYHLLEKDSDSGDRAKRQLFTVLLLVYAALLLMKFLFL